MEHTIGEYGVLYHRFAQLLMISRIIRPLLTTDITVSMKKSASFSAARNELYRNKSLYPPVL